LLEIAFVVSNHTMERLGELQDASVVLYTNKVQVIWSWVLIYRVTKSKMLFSLEKYIGCR
jgi:hypothetical protein